MTFLKQSDKKCSDLITNKTAPSKPQVDRNAMMFAQPYKNVMYHNFEHETPTKNPMQLHKPCNCVTWYIISCYRGYAA